MNIKAFLRYVEIQTKLASLIPFLLGSTYLYYKFHTFNPVNFLLMFISLICIDMCTTGINNYMDYKTAIKKDGYGYEEHNSIVKYNINPKTAKLVIYILILISIFAGFILFIKTNIIVLIIGVISFAIGISYTFGPLPISRTPFGELISGLSMGLIIPFLAIYIHVFDSYLIYSVFQNGIWTLSLNIKELFYIFVFSIPSITCISNIMLANNICDVEEDMANGRNTLPIWLGRKKSLIIWVFLYAVSYCSIILLIILKIVPVIYVLALLSAPLVIKNVKMFVKRHVKSETFTLSVRNFALINALDLVVLIFIAFF